MQKYKYVTSGILTLGTTLERAVSDIESVSDDLKTRCDVLSYQDKWAVMKPVGVAATAATGVGSLYTLALIFPRLTSAGPFCQLCQMVMEQLTTFFRQLISSSRAPKNPRRLRFTAPN